MAALVCEPIGPIVPMLVAVTLDMFHPELSGRGFHERGQSFIHNTPSVPV
jgi:hypothetical protein